jgi:hypothetical protein
MKSIRCGRGLGDSIYLESVCRHLIETTGEPLRIASDWPDVFAPLNGDVSVVPFTRMNIDIIAHYSRRKGDPTTTQFQDCCIGAGIKEHVELRLDWFPTTSIGDKLLATDKPIVCVGLPRAPMGRTDEFGKEILPRAGITQAIIDRLKDRATIVQIGSGDPLHQYKGIDVDLANKTTVAELLDVCHAASGFVGYVSFILAAAEALHKPSIMVWARAGLNAKQEYVRQIAPGKIIEFKDRCSVVFDDAPMESVQEVADAFLQ